VSIGGLSAHAGQDFLIRYATTVKDRVKQTFLVHGEEQPAATLTAKLGDQGMHGVHYPPLHSSIEL
jgi:predicted metal-dependent RNase